MAVNILLDYAFKFSEVTGVQEADLSYLKDVAVIVKSASDLGGVAESHEITKAEDASQWTTAANLDALFTGGLNIVTLIVCDALDDSKQLLDETSQYTALIAEEWEVAEIEQFDPTEYLGVVGAVFGDKTKAEAFVVDQKRCAFLDATTPKAYGMYYAFAKMLSGVYWRDQQYLQVVSTQVTTVENLGDAESLFPKVSFYLGDDQYGKRLGFFGGGAGMAITEPYIDEEVKRNIQAAGVNYLALNQPRNIAVSRALLEDTLQDEIDTYTKPPYQYLDPDGTTEIDLTTSNEAFVLNGSLTTKVADPIWRVKVEARQEA